MLGPVLGLQRTTDGAGAVGEVLSGTTQAAFASLSVKSEQEKRCEKPRERWAYAIVDARDAFGHATQHAWAKAHSPVGLFYFGYDPFRRGAAPVTSHIACMKH